MRIPQHLLAGDTENPSAVRGRSTEGKIPIGIANTPNFISPGDITGSESLLQIALAHAANGYRVHPLRPRQKVPLLTEWEKLATTKPGQIQAWWSKYPDANVGIAPGLSNLVVIDPDAGTDTAGKVKEGPKEWAGWLAHNHLTGQPTVTTPSGGEHWYYRVSEPVGNRTSFLPHVDAKSANGNIVAPGSIFGGRTYTNPDGTHGLPPVANLPDAPEALLKLLRKEEKPRTAQPLGAAGVRAALKREIQAILDAPDGTGNDTINRAAYNLGQLVGPHLAEDEARTALNEAGRKIRNPADKVAATVDSGLSKGMQNPREVAPEPQKRAPAPQEEEGKPEKKSAATLLVELARATYRFGQSDEGDVFGIRPGSHVVRNLSGDKTSLRSELSGEFFDRYGKVAAQQALADAQGVIEGFAQREDAEPVQLRVAEADGAIWIDLGDVQERVIRLADGDWEIRTEAPVLFARTALTAEFPTPTKGTDLGQLWGHLNVNELDRPLVLAWLAQVFLQPELPHPVLTLFGEQGTAKSTLTRRLVSLVDPSPVPARKPPKDGEAWISAAQGSYAVGLDNLSSIPDWFSDSLCRASTGDGDIRRTLYKDKRLTVFSFRRAVILNGIDVGALKSDLASRAVLVNLDRIGKVRTEREMAETWEADHPGLVGAVLSFAAKIREELPTITVENPPRMADYAHVLAAVDRLLGTNGTSRYAELEETLAEDAITANPFLAQIVEQGLDLHGTAKEILQKVGHGEHWDRVKGWPSTPRYVSTLLKRNGPALRKAGWQVEEGVDRKRKVSVWSLTAPREGEQSDLFG